MKDYVGYLSLMAIQRANSGHPGLPLGCAAFGVVLYRYFLKFNPQDPFWLARDRFVLSAGHGSMLLYSLGYLFNQSITLKDLGRFRQWGSITAGHPEYNLAASIETTTGPLGQGFANAVGIALESQLLKHRFKKQARLFDFNCYVLLGDGCMMEGITQEAASLAGNLKLNNLIAIYDDNQISIDGRTDLTFSENVALKFKALGWEVLKVKGDNVVSIFQGLKKIHLQREKPKLIVLKTKIGKGLNQLEDNYKAHGNPPGINEIVYFIKNSTIKSFFADEDSLLEEEVREQIATGDFLAKEQIFQEKWFHSPKNAKQYQNWKQRYEKFHEQSVEYQQFSGVLSGGSSGVPEELAKKLRDFKIAKPQDSTRNICSAVLELCAEALPTLVGGSADLVASTKATIKSSRYVKAGDFSGRNIAFGVREHAMAAINNGLSLSRTFIPFSSTFLSFLDYLKPALRLSALAKLKHLFIFSHDSIQVGEDGPTHQPIEQLNTLRLLPGHYTFRPANDRELAFSFLYFLENDFPVSIITTRQTLAEECFKQQLSSYSSFKKGAYCLAAPAEVEDVVLLGSGSEVGLLLQCQAILKSKSVAAKVVSVPCLELLERSSLEWKRELLGDFKKPVYFLEAASFRSLSPLFHANLHVKCINEFGASAPKEKLLEEFDFVVERVVAEVLAIVEK